MAFAITCDACGKSFTIPDDIYQRRVAGRLVTIKCKQCQGSIRVDDRPADAKDAPAAPPKDAASASSAATPGRQRQPSVADARGSGAVRQRLPSKPDAAKAKQPSAPALAEPRATPAGGPRAKQPSAPAIGEPRAIPAAPFASRLKLDSGLGIGANAPRAIAGTAPSAATRKPTPAAGTVTPRQQPAPPAAQPTRAPVPDAAARTSSPDERASVKPPKPLSARPRASIPPSERPDPSDEPPIEALWAVDYGDADRELTLPQIGEAFARGEVSLETLVWHIGMPDWMSIVEVPELSAHLANTAPARYREEVAALEALEGSESVGYEESASAEQPAGQQRRDEQAPIASGSAAGSAAVDWTATAAEGANRESDAARTSSHSLAEWVQEAAQAAPLTSQGSAPTDAVAAGLPGAAPAVGVPDLRDIERAAQRRKQVVLGAAAFVGLMVVGFVIILIIAGSRGPEITPLAASTRPAPTQEAAREPNALPASAPAAATQPPATDAADAGAAADDPARRGFMDLFSKAAADASVGNAPFDAKLAKQAVDRLAGSVGRCSGPGGPGGQVSVKVTFAPTGRVVGVDVQNADIKASAVGTCISAAVKSARVPAYLGKQETVTATYSLD